MLRCGRGREVREGKIGSNNLREVRKKRNRRRMKRRRRGRYEHADTE